MLDPMLCEYDDLLIGRTPALDTYHFYGREPGGANEKKALLCIRYCLEVVLGWSEEEACRKFDRYILELMHLSRIAAYIRYPVEMEDGDPRYILSLLYPKKIRISPDALIIETLLSVENNRDNATEGESIRQFPREYFSGGVGFHRFCVCIKYLLENFTRMSNCDDVYRFFRSPEGQKFLTEYRLKVPAEQFAIPMNEVIHTITEDNEDSDLYYSYYKFLDAFPHLTGNSTAAGCGDSPLG